MHPDVVSGLVSRLIELRHATDPRAGPTSARGKDINAFTACRFAHHLTATLAGWAVNHQVGLAHEGREYASDPPQEGVDLPEYLEQRAEADDHRHELVGAELERAQEIDPLVARKAMINLLYANPGAFPEPITRMMIEALEALDYNEVLPILKPPKAGRKVKYREQRMRLKALAMIAYRVARGMKKVSAIEEVADAFGVDPETVKSWEKRLPDDLGKVEISRAVSGAKREAKNEAEALRRLAKGEWAGKQIGEELYGRSALQNLARRYKAVQKERRA